jgi:hypothetical protein
MMIGARTKVASIVSATTMTTGIGIIAGEITASVKATEHRVGAGRASPFRMECVSHTPVESRAAEDRSRNVR